jgi:hypothetical protein
MITKISVSSYFEEKINTGDYSNATFGSGLKVTAKLEEGEKFSEIYSALSKSVNNQVKMNVHKQIDEYINNLKKIKQGRKIK